jgi:alkylresorcinol/alkylpyrone synthase
MSPEDVFSNLSFEERNAIYVKESIKLGATCLQSALEKAAWKPEDLDYIITVSCTGIMIPSLDAYLINLVKLKTGYYQAPCNRNGLCSRRFRDDLRKEFFKGQSLVNGLQL